LDLLGEHHLTIAGLASIIGIHPTHLSVVLRGIALPRMTVAIGIRITECFGLNPDYFYEVRQYQLLESINADPKLVDRLYDRYVRRPQ